MRVFVLLALMGIACKFEPDYPNGLPCGVGPMRCPSGYTCKAEICCKGGVCPGPAVDASQPDAPASVATDAPAEMVTAPDRPATDAPGSIEGGSAERPADGGADAVGARDAETDVVIEGPSWRAAERIARSLSGATAPLVAIDPLRGDATVVWLDGSDIRAVRYDAATSKWGTEREITKASGGFAPDVQVGVDVTGKALVLWTRSISDTTLEGIWSSESKDGMTWTAPVRVWAGRPTGLALGIWRNGKARAAWAVSRLTEAALWSAYYDGTAWTAGAVLKTAQNFTGQSPRLALDTAGDGHLVFIDNDQGTRSVWAARLSGATIGTPAVIESNNSDSAGDLRASSNPAGRAAAVWRHGQQIWANNYVPPMGWQGAKQVSGAGIDPEVVADGQGAATVVWTTTSTIDNTYTISASRETATGWATPQIVGTSIYFTERVGGYDLLWPPSPRITADARGNVNVVWLKRTTPRPAGTFTVALATRRFSATTMKWLDEQTIASRDLLQVGSRYDIATADDGQSVAAFHYVDYPTHMSPERGQITAAVLK